MEAQRQQAHEAARQPREAVQRQRPGGRWEHDARASEQNEGGRRGG
jgi:hypothetical protein